MIKKKKMVVVEKAWTEKKVGRMKEKGKRRDGERTDC